MRWSGKAGAADLSKVELGLAGALWDARKDRRRALRLARQALADAEAAGEKERAESAKKWLATHRARPH